MDLLCPFYEFHLLQVFPDFVFPSGLGSSYWSSCEWFPFSILLTYFYFKDLLQRNSLSTCGVTKLFLQPRILLRMINILRQKLYRVSQEECARLREGVSYIKVYRYNPKHLCPKLNGYGDKGARKVWSSCGSTYCTWFA